MLRLDDYVHVITMPSTMQNLNYVFRKLVIWTKKQLSAEISKKNNFKGLVLSVGQLRMIVRLGKRILFVPIITCVHVKKSSLKLRENVNRVSESAVRFLITFYYLSIEFDQEKMLNVSRTPIVPWKTPNVLKMVAKLSTKYVNAKKTFYLSKTTVWKKVGTGRRLFSSIQI